MNEIVTKFLEELNHPFRNEIEKLRQIILAANDSLVENIKWNAPNYSIDNADRITMRIMPPKKQVQLIFHRGAKVKEAPKHQLVADKSKLLIWKEMDRAVATFNNMEKIESAKSDLTEIVNEWISNSYEL